MRMTSNKSRADSIEQCYIFESNISALCGLTIGLRHDNKTNLKCEFLYPDRKSFEHKNTVNDHVIHSKEFCRDLVVCVDNRLSYHMHRLNIARNAQYTEKLFF